MIKNLQDKLFSLVNSSVYSIISNEKITEDIYYSSLLNKIYTHFFCINNLINMEFFNEARIIARSALEATVNYIYLLHYPKDRRTYELDSQMLGLKNLFMTLKEYREVNDNIAVYVAQNTFGKSKEEMIETLKVELISAFYEQVDMENQKRVLEYLKINKFEMTECVYEKLQKYFRNPPLFQNLEEMYRRLYKKGVLVGDVNIRELFFPVYNLYSQIAHGAIKYGLSTHKQPLDILRFIFNAHTIILHFTREILKIIPNYDKNEVLKIQKLIDDLYTPDDF